ELGEELTRTEQVRDGLEAVEAEFDRLEALAGDGVEDLEGRAGVGAEPGPVDACHLAARRFEDGGPPGDALVAGVGQAVVETVVAASRSMTQLLAVDPAAIDVLADLDRRRPMLAATPDGLVAWKRREYLRIAARDLLGLDGLGAVGAALAEMAEDAVRGALHL